MIDNVHVIWIFRTGAVLCLRPAWENAQKDNFSSLVQSFTITVERIRGEIVPNSNLTVINIQPGDDATLTIYLNDTILGGMIKTAEVRYYWEFGQGELLDPDDDGIFSVILEDVPRGTFSITITANAGSDYQIDTLEITINSQPTSTGPKGVDLLVVL